MGIEVACCLLLELKGPKTATSDSLRSSKMKFKQGGTSKNEPHVFIGEMATKDKMVAK